MKNVFLALTVATIFGLPSVVDAKDFRLIADPSVPAATGTVSVNKDRNGNQKIRVEVKHLAKPSALTPPKQAYVVWVQSRGGQPENEGQLRVNDKLEGSLETTTPHEQFDIFITAEDNPDTQVPTGPPLLHGTVAP
jgi:hypothetical protein